MKNFLATFWYPRCPQLAMYNRHKTKNTLFFGYPFRESPQCAACVSGGSERTQGWAWTLNHLSMYYHGHVWSLHVAVTVTENDKFWQNNDIFSQYRQKCRIFAEIEVFGENAGATRVLVLRSWIFVQNLDQRLKFDHLHDLLPLEISAHAHMGPNVGKWQFQNTFSQQCRKFHRQQKYNYLKVRIMEMHFALRFDRASQKLTPVDSSRLYAFLKIPKFSINIF